MMQRQYDAIRSRGRGELGYLPDACQNARGDHGGVPVNGTRIQRNRNHEEKGHETTCFDRNVPHARRIGSASDFRAGCHPGNWRHPGRLFAAGGIGLSRSGGHTDGKTNDLPATLAAGRYHVVLHNTNATNGVGLDFYMPPAGTSADDAIAIYNESVSSEVAARPLLQAHDSGWRDCPAEWHGRGDHRFESG